MTDDPIRRALDDLAAIPPDVVPTRPRRPDRATVARLLAANGRTVTTTETTITTDVDGIPSGVSTTERRAVLYVDLHALGWTQAEYDDPTITE